VSTGDFSVLRTDKFHILVFWFVVTNSPEGRLRLKCDVTRAETRFRLSAKRKSPFKLAGASVHSTTGKRAVHSSLQRLYCSCKPVFCSHVTLSGYPLHSLVFPSLLPCVTVCHHISNAVYQRSTATLTSTYQTVWCHNPGDHNMSSSVKQL
jgi:hypothetical protein